MSYVTDKFKKIVKIIPTFNVGSSNVIKAIGDKACTVDVINGTIWINPNEVATIENGAMVNGSIDIKLDDTLNIISDLVGADVQIIIWGD